jgi:beta-phosphoglucomutase-like phosphatase (HAD superfamily)
MWQGPAGLGLRAGRQRGWAGAQAPGAARLWGQAGQRRQHRAGSPGSKHRRASPAAGASQQQLAQGDLAGTLTHPPALPYFPLSYPRHPQTPIAFASTAPERRVRPTLERLDLARTFTAIVTAEDNGSAELENSYLAASHLLQRPPLRCVVLGDGNRAVEAARELGMKSVVVTGGQPAWNFGAADLVVRNLGALTFANMKNLFSQEDLVEPSTPWDDINASRQREEEEALSGRAGGSFSSAGAPGGRPASSSGWSSSAGGGGAHDLASAGSLSSTAASGWWPGGRERERERELEPAGAAVAAFQSEGPYKQEAPRRGSPGGSEEEDEEFEVVLPPPGAAFWDS